MPTGAPFGGPEMNRLPRRNRKMNRSIEGWVPCASVVAFALLGFTAGCSGGSSSGTGTGGAGGGGSSAGVLPYKPCATGTRVGGFNFQLVPADMGSTPYSQLGGGVRDKTMPSETWKAEMKDGECSLMVPPFGCSPACTSGQACVAANTCATAGVYQDVGTVTMTGPASPLVANPTQNTYSESLTTYPPFAEGTVVHLAAAGKGSIAAFALEGRGIAGVQAPTADIPLKTGQALTVSWTPPASGGSSRVQLALDIAHHGGVKATIECDVPDTGSKTISAALLSALVAKGTAGFPIVSITRQTLDSTMATPGCVEFAVSSHIERSLTIDGLTSCMEDTECPTGKTCRPAGVANGLTCTQ